MYYVVAILIAGLWAAFLLPSFFDHRSRAPKTTTRDFARTKQVLGQVSAAEPDGAEYVRRHAQMKRQRILVGLVLTAVFTLVVATWTGSIAWLWATIAFNIATAGYVALLLYVKQQSLLPKATVVPIAAARLSPVVAAVPQPEFEESRTVRVIAG